MAPDTSKRANALADAAIAVIARGGLRALTHRAVEAEAGLPPGSTSYYFASRSALVRGVIVRLLERDREDFVAFGVLEPHEDRASMVRSWTSLLSHFSTKGRDRQIARYAIYLDGETDDESRVMLDEATAAVRQGAEQLARSLGSRHWRRDGRLLVALLDGLLYDQVARPPAGGLELRRRIEVVFDAVIAAKA